MALGFSFFLISGIGVLRRRADAGVAALVRRSQDYGFKVCSFFDFGVWRFAAQWLLGSVAEARG